MNITVTYWDEDIEKASTYSGDPAQFHIWLKGMLATGVLVTRVVY